MTTAKTPGAGSGFAAVFGGTRGHPSGYTPPSRPRPTAITRARVLVAWADATEMTTTDPDFCDLLHTEAVKNGLSIEPFARGAQQAESSHYIDHDIPLLVSIYDGDTQIIIGLIELAGSRVQLLHYDRPFPRRTGL